MASFKLLATIFIFYNTLFLNLSDAKPTNSNDEQIDVMNLERMESSEEGFADSLIEPRMKEDDNEEEVKNLELGKFYQGDMKLEPEQMEAMVRNETEQSKVESRTGLLSETYRWPKNSKGNVVVPFRTEGFNQRQSRNVKAAMDEISAATCVIFVPRTTQADYVLLRDNREGCSSNIGKIGGEQILSLEPGCFEVGTIVHELIHALGYTHMHNHIDRDKFVRIYRQNIEPGMAYNFDKVNIREFGNFATPYDYYSLMHYQPDAFAARRGQYTMVPLRNPQKYMRIIGQRTKMSKGDKKRINNMYKCKI